MNDNQENKNELGATGEFPNGKLNPADEGQIKLSMGIKDGVLILDFGTPIIWIGLDKVSAEAMGRNLLLHAARLPV